jgi:hypothetical protein
MQWDLGLQGLALLGALSLGFGVLAGALVGRHWARRMWTVAITIVACFGMGLMTSEVFFGWATEEELQPNVDGLSRDEVLLSSVLTTTVVVLVMRYLVHRLAGPAPRAGKHALGGPGRHHAGHA